MDSSGHPPRPKVVETVDKMEEDIEAVLQGGLDHVASLHKDSLIKTEDRIHKLNGRTIHPDDFRPESSGLMAIVRHLQRPLHAEQGEPRYEKRMAILEFLESARCEVALLMLVVIDVVMVVIEATLDSVFTFAHGDGHRRLALVGDTHGSASTCDAERAQMIANACRIISMVVLFVFLVELLTKALIAPRAFVKHAGHIVDFVVVVGSVVFELTLHHSEGGLLIFFRLWRFVRIGHGFYEQVEHVIKGLETEVQLEHTLEHLQRYKKFTEARDLHEEYHIYKRSGTSGLVEHLQSQRRVGDPPEPAKGAEDAREAATLSPEAVVGAKGTEEAQEAATAAPQALAEAGAA